MHRRRLITLGLTVALLGMTGVAKAQYTTKDAPFTADWVYKALLNRNIDAPSLAGAVSEIQKGNLKAWVDAIVASPEFKKSEGGKSAADMLDQIYQGLLARAPDDQGRQAFLMQTAQKKYRDVVLTVINSPEYRKRLTSVK